MLFGLFKEIGEDFKDTFPQQKSDITTFEILLQTAVQLLYERPVHTTEGVNKVRVVLAMETYVYYVIIQYIFSYQE